MKIQLPGVRMLAVFLFLVGVVPLLAQGGVVLREFPNGSRFEGEMKEGKPHGSGTLSRKDGTSYTGEWVDGKRQGRGNCRYSNGMVYEGEWLGGKRQGKGKLSLPKGNPEIARYESFGKWEKELFVVIGEFEQDRFVPPVTREPETPVSPNLAPAGDPSMEAERLAEEKIKNDPADAEGTRALFLAAQKVEEAYLSGDVDKIRSLMTESGKTEVGERLKEVPSEVLRSYGEAFKTRRCTVKSELMAEFSFLAQNGKKFTSAFARAGPTTWKLMR